jgi:hypothetical protein
MIKVYTAANLQDAHLLMGLLRTRGIEAQVLNAAAQGGLGEIPFTQTYPEIWLVHARDLDRARALCAEFDAAPAAGVDTQCPACGEPSPSTFEVCWNCGAALASVNPSSRARE